MGWSQQQHQRSAGPWPPDCRPAQRWGSEDSLWMGLALAMAPTNGPLNPSAELGWPSKVALLAARPCQPAVETCVVAVSSRRLRESYFGAALRRLPPGGWASRRSSWSSVESSLQPHPTRPQHARGRKQQAAPAASRTIVAWRGV